MDEWFLSMYKVKTIIYFSSSHLFFSTSLPTYIARCNQKHQLVWASSITEAEQHPSSGWCTGGCWFILAVSWFNACKINYSVTCIHTYIHTYTHIHTYMTLVVQILLSLFFRPAQSHQCYLASYSFPSESILPLVCNNL